MPHNPLGPPDARPGPRSPGFSCLRSETEHTVCLTVDGELDIATVPELDRALRRAEADADLVVLDLRALDFMDSSGAHLLVATDRRIRRAGGRLAVVRGPAEIEWFFELIRIDRQLGLVEEPPGRTRAAIELEAVPVGSATHWRPRSRSSP